MRAVIQRVNEANVKVDHEIVGQINKGLLVLLGITEGDNELDIKWITHKIINLRIFSDSEGKMNLSLNEANGEILLVSQFTLYASVKKGNRPSYLRSAKPNIAIPLYESVVEEFKSQNVLPEEGIFGADMQVELVNDGPVTIIIDSQNRE